MTWVLAVLSLVGIILNIHKKRICFIIWMITNFAWMLVDIKKNIPAQAFLFFVYFLLAIWGWVKWKKA